MIKKCVRERRVKGGKRVNPSLRETLIRTGAFGCFGLNCLTERILMALK